MSFPRFVNDQNKHTTRTETTKSSETTDLDHWHEGGHRISVGIDHRDSGGSIHLSEGVEENHRLKRVYTNLSRYAVLNAVLSFY